MPILRVEIMVYLQKSWRHISLTLLFALLLTSLAYVADGMEIHRPSWESQSYLIEGVHYLVNEGDRDMAEESFRRAILSSSFSSLSGKDGADETSELMSRWVLSEAFYFLGKIHYEKAASQGAVPQNIAWAKRYLEKADEYGVIYDRFHPPLLYEINRKYPGLDAPLSETISDKVKIIVKIEHGAYEMDAIRVGQNADVTESRFRTNEEFDLDCGAIYKVKPNIWRSNKSMYGALAALGISLAIWLTRG